LPHSPPPVGRYDAPVPGEHSVTEYHGLKLAWRQEFSGGGRGFGQSFIPVVEHLFGRVNRLLEFCAGPGYIGFALLARGLCEHLVLSDVNPRALDMARETVRLNGLEEQVTIYESDGLKDIPASERWDLVISNPPHYPSQVGKAPSLILEDPDWRLHREFFARVGDFLAPGASVLFLENSEGAAPEEFVAMIEEGGLSYVRTVWYTGPVAAAHHYFLWAKQSLPELAFDEDSQAVTLELHAEQRPAPEFPAGRPLALRLLNKTGRQVRPRLMDAAGKDVLWLRLDPIDADGELRLPLLALKPGDYEVQDRAEDAAVARLVAG
jgi:16S rRNA G966 N2-methylase RsmD